MAKIVVVLAAPLSEEGGRQTRVRGVTGLLAERHRVSIIGPGDRPRLLLSTVLRSLRVIAAILRERPDIIWCAEDWFGFPLYYPFIRARGCRFVLQLHGIESELTDPPIPRWKRRLYGFLQGLAARRADHITAPGEDTFSFFWKYNHNISLAPLFVDTAVFTGPENTKRLPRTEKLVGFIGPFPKGEPDKEASLQFLYRDLERFDPRVHFVVIGHCDFRIQHPRITYTGHLPSIETYAKQLRELDTVLAYRRNHPGPYNRAVDAMACGVPVFTTPIGMVGFGKATPGEDILVFPEEELLARINELVFDDELMARVGRNARATVEKYYSKSAVREKLLAIIEDLVKGKTCHKGKSR